MLSPSLQVIFLTWDLPFRIIIASAVLIIPTALAALAFSSMTLESRYAAFAWFATWIVGHVTYSVLVAFQTMNSPGGPDLVEPGWRVLTSPYQVLAAAQAFIFGFSQDTFTVVTSFLVLGIVAGASIVVLFRRVNAPMSQ